MASEIVSECCEVIRLNVQEKVALIATSVCKFFSNIFYSKKHVEKSSKFRNPTNLTNVISRPNNVYVACLYNYIENSDETISK